MRLFRRKFKMAFKAFEMLDYLACRMIFCLSSNTRHQNFVIQPFDYIVIKRL